MLGGYFMPGFVLNYANVKAWAERLQLPFRFSDDASQIAITCRLLDSDVPLVFIPRLERGMLTMALTMPFSVPRDRYVQVGQALTLLNARSYMGAWILNLEKGEIYFRITVPALDVVYTDQSLRFVASVVASSADTMSKPLRAVACEGARPETVADVTSSVATP
jgi:hypothetical protein